MQFIQVNQGFKLGATKTTQTFPFSNGIQHSVLGLGWESLLTGTDLKVCL